ncbi:eukaryotic translation initiation factor 5A-1-like isoform X2 [Apium graveolens]|uniref:eukaryotic translation initiation factor 5A-1-like isoform X2 n=1 Tax=Apium graveolens TaxID=4045 RepID=UPI003D7AA9EC
MVHARDFWGYDSVKNCPRNIGFMPETRTVEQKVKDLRSFVCFENCPCKIVEIVTPIDPAKRRFDRTKRQYVAIGIFTEKVFEATFSLSDTCDVPIVTLTDYELVDIYEKDSHVTLLDDKGQVWVGFRKRRICFCRVCYGKGENRCFKDSEEKVAT